MNANRRLQGRPRGTTKVKPNTDLVQTHGQILAELRELSPISQEPTYNAQRRFNPAAFEAIRTKMFTELLDEEGPGDHLIARLRERPKDFNPTYLETYRRCRDSFDELIANRTKQQVEEDAKRLEQMLSTESNLLDTHYDHSENRRYVVNKLKAALEQAEKLLAEFDTSPVRLHAIERHLKHRSHSHWSEDECIACSNSVASASPSK